ncbi:MAG TPA: cytochrome bc complex cytochrome b subunit [Solirubrobacterales bacterium]
MIRRTVRALDERLGAAPPVKKALRYVFPDHWTFMLGEIAMYCFVILVITGIFLTFYYVPSGAKLHYQGPYLPLQGTSMGENYASVLQISFTVPAGLLIRQTHHWAADVFIVAIVLHLLRVLITGAYRKPRELNYWVGVTMLGLAILEGFLGYSLVDDLLSGMGLAIAYAVAMSIPFVGGPFAFLIWNGEYPGTESFWPRLEVLHVFLIPMAIATLLAVHLAQIVRQHHTQFPAEGSERKVRGTPAWPGYALRSIGLFFVVAGVLFLLGGLIQINPIWEWGPYEPYLSTNGAQPDWYVGWLIGALRLMPPLEITIGSYTVVPAPFWGGALFPAFVFGVLYAWPALARRLVDDRRKHNLLERPRDNPRRTALVLAFVGWVFTIFAAGATDRLYFRSFIPYEGQVWFFRGLALLIPFVIYFVAKRVCEELRDRDERPLQGREQHPLRGWSGSIVRRTRSGGFENTPP